MKLFHTSNVHVDTVKGCFEMPSSLLKERAENFQKQYQNHQNAMCQTVNNFKLS